MAKSEADWYKKKFLDFALIRRDLEKDAFEFVVQESIKMKMTFNQFTIFKAKKLNCDPEFIQIMQENSEFITDIIDIISYLDACRDRLNVLDCLLSTKTFDSKSGKNCNWGVNLVHEIQKYLELTPLLLEVLDLKTDFFGFTVLDLFVMKEKITKEDFE